MTNHFQVVLYLEELKVEDQYMQSVRIQKRMT